MDPSPETPAPRPEPTPASTPTPAPGSQRYRRSITGLLKQLADGTLVPMPPGEEPSAFTPRGHPALIRTPLPQASAPPAPPTTQPATAPTTRRLRRSVDGLVDVSLAATPAVLPPEPAVTPPESAVPSSGVNAGEAAAPEKPRRLRIDPRNPVHTRLVRTHLDAIFKGRSLTDLVRMGQILGAWWTSAGLPHQIARIHETVANLLAGFDVEIEAEDLHRSLLLYLDPTRLNTQPPPSSKTSPATVRSPRPD